MSVTSDSAKIKYFVGNFNYTTGLTLPSVSQKNTLTLNFETDIGDQLADFGNVTGDEIFVLLHVTLGGTTVYKNQNYDSPSTSVAPTDPDLTISLVLAPPLTTEVTTVQNYIPMVTTSDGATSTGQYVVNARFVYLDDTTSADYTYEDGVFTSNYSYSEKEPDLSYYYDTLVPRLNVSDETNYTFSGSLPERDTEFVLYPPENRASQTNTFDNVQSVNYSTFYSGGNEVRYTVLMEYEFTNEIIVNAQQEYESFTVYRVDRCKLYDCLNEQYNLWVSSTCSGSLRQQRQDNYNKANGLALQILTGQSCNKTTLTSVIEAFNALCDCDCDCLDETPTLIQPSTAISDDNIQDVISDSAETSVDLSAGSTVNIELTATGGTTELTVTNIEYNKNYRFIVTTDGTSQTLTFDSSIFEDSDGVPLDVDPTGTYRVILDFYAATTGMLSLVSRSDA